MKKKIISLMLAAALSVIALTGCAGRPAAIPFTDASLKWNASEKNVFDIEGKEYETYTSVYGGPTYTYPKTYMDKEGTIKYMFNDKKKLVSVSWTYVADNADDINSMYTKIQTPLKEELGESGFSQGGITSAGDVWYRKDGNIILYTMLTSELNALQYSYLSPEVSSDESEKVNDSDAALDKLQQLAQ